MSGYESFNPDDHQDPFDPRLLGASRMAQLSPDDADDYISQQMAHGEPTDNNWFAQFDDPHNFSSLPPGHKWVQFADEVDDGEDPRYFQAVPESTPEGHERWHVRGAEGGWRYDPHELVFHDHLPPGLQRGEFGIWSPIKDTGHENWNPDDKQDPFDPRLIGASRVDDPQPVDCPECGGEGYVNPAHGEGRCFDCEHRWHHDIDDHQDPFDPRLIGAALRRVGYEKLINPHHDHGDEDYGHIFGMLRQAGWDMADIVRLAGDGMSWEDTMAHIDQVLAEGEHEHGEPEHDHSMAYHDPDCAGWPTCSGCGYLNADGEWRDGPTPPEDAPFQDNRANGLPDDYTH